MDSAGHIRGVFDAVHFLATELARRTARSLEAARLALEREQTLASVGALAAAAAHELGTPLATIAVTARELADVLSESSADPILAEDAAPGRGNRSVPPNPHHPFQPRRPAKHRA